MRLLGTWFKCTPVVHHREGTGRPQGPERKNYRHPLRKAPQRTMKMRSYSGSGAEPRPSGGDQRDPPSTMSSWPMAVWGNACDLSGFVTIETGTQRPLLPNPTAWGSKPRAGG